MGFVWKGFIIENTLKEEWTDKNDFYDNYNLVYRFHLLCVLVVFLRRLAKNAGIAGAAMFWLPDASPFSPMETL